MALKSTIFKIDLNVADLDRQAPCDLDVPACRYRGADSADLEAFAEKWGLGRVAARVPRR